MRELELKEMELVSAGFAVPGAVVGAAAGAGAYVSGKLAAGETPSALGTVGSAAIGAFAGFFGGPMGANTAVNVIGATSVGGAVTGGVTKMNSNNKSGDDYCEDGGNY